jgi:glucosamine--fructose-6-phosphate aminotransferase (isomerizing)
MCGVVGFVGKGLVQKLILNGLACLEYRGYDSTGFACIEKDTKKLSCVKVVGSLDNLTEKIGKSGPDGFVGVGHTRWATHGMTTLHNAHPHIDCKGSSVVVHNGIIENHRELRTLLQKEGHLMRSESDSEVIIHLAERALDKKQSPLKLLQELSKELKGSYAYILLMEQFPDTLLMARNRAPLCLGIGKDGMAVASDPLAFGKRVNELIFLPDKSFAIVNGDTYAIFDFNGNQLDIQSEPAGNHVIFSDKGDYEHYMLKEIYEQKQAIYRTVYSHRSGGTIEEYLGLSAEELQELDEIILVGCGTSWHAGLIGKFFFESIANVKVTVELASELRYRKVLSGKNTLCIAISQSGQTADTLEAVSIMKELNIPVIALTNVAYSSLVRECDGLLLTEAGPEVAVASTKAFSTQIATLYWVAHQIAHKKGLIDKAAMVQSERNLVVVAEALEENIERCKKEIIDDVDLYRTFKNYIFLGRHITYPFALEAALKLKEISYVFTHAYPAGELKHGPLALVDSDVPVVLFSHADPEVYKKLLANAQEVKARGGFLIVFACQGQQELIELADKSFELKVVDPLLAPLAMTGVMQYFCYALAKAQGRSIDKPRNLAKSVTVE